MAMTMSLSLRLMIMMPVTVAAFGVTPTKCSKKRFPYMVANSLILVKRYLI
jgi:hypothetical protein